MLTLPCLLPQVRKDPRTEAFYADGLTQAPVQSAGRTLKVLAAALSWRHTRAHKLNNYSSRSHCLISLTIMSQDRQAGQDAQQGSMRRHVTCTCIQITGTWCEQLLH